MKNPLRFWASATVGIAAALAFTSCAYDPNYSYAGGTYSSGYGDGYGYGNSNFTTSVFIGTGNPRWGYDPYCYSYYDYQRHCYYDPYLYGYYPIGYRPPVIIGAPHPYGWRPGHGNCPPPHRVNNVTVANYHNRESAYRNSNYGWANQVRIQHQQPNRNSDYRSNTGSRPSGGNYNQQPNRNSDYRSNPGSRPPSSSGSPQSHGRNSYTQGSQPNNYSPTYERSGEHKQKGASTARAYVPGQPSPQVNKPSHSSRQPDPRRASPPMNQNAAPQYQRSHGGGDANPRSGGNPNKDKKDNKGMRSLGQG